MDKKEGKITRFKNWFFKGRIDKKKAEEERINSLSKEYDEGKFVKCEVTQ